MVVSDKFFFTVVTELHVDGGNGEVIACRIALVGSRNSEVIARPSSTVGIESTPRGVVNRCKANLMTNNAEFKN